jgi:hypothetical protein
MGEYLGPVKGHNGVIAAITYPGKGNASAVMFPPAISQQMIAAFHIASHFKPITEGKNSRLKPPFASFTQTLPVLPGCCGGRPPVSS